VGLTTHFPFDTEVKHGYSNNSAPPSVSPVQCSRATSCLSCFSCHQGMTRPQVADAGDSVEIWMVAANVLRKQLRSGNR
jgi:hypothetical protein